MESLRDVLRRAEVARQRVPDTPLPAVCPMCRGAGYLRYDVPVEDPRFGQLVVCECTRRDLERRRMQRLIETSNLGALRRHTFESFIAKFREGKPPQFSPDAAYIAARDWAHNPVGWIVFQGGLGTGKTHLAVAIANYRLSLGEPAVFIVVPDLLDHLRSAFSPNSEVTYDDLFETVRNTPLLVLDDLGTQTSTPWAREKLFQILNHRYNKALPTVITTNSDPGEIDPRLWSRMSDPQSSRLCVIRDIDKRMGRAHTMPQTGQTPRRTGKIRDEEPRP